MAAAPHSAAAADGDIVLRTLLDDVDAVLQGTIASLEKAAGGLWHRLEVEDVLSGRGRGGAVQLFAHGAGVPESIAIYPGERIIVGVRWLSRAGGGFHGRLLADLDARGLAEPAGLIAADGTLRLSDARARRLAEDLRAALAARPAATGALDDSAASTALSGLASEHLPLRLDALRRLSAASELPDDARRRLPGAFAEAVRSGAPANEIVAYLDVVRRHDLDGCGASLAQLVAGRAEPVLVEEGIDALSRDGSGDGIDALIRRFPSSTERARGTILRALGRARWAGTVHFCRQALRSPDPQVQAAAVEALGELETLESTTLLGETIDRSPPQIRGLAIQALARCRSPESREALRAALERCPESERWRLRRALAAALVDPAARKVLGLTSEPSKTAEKP